MNKVTIRDIDVDNKKVLVRCDFNVPLAKDGSGVITDNKRITAALPTINYLLDHGAKVILCSHLGRPDGQVKPEFSLAPVQQELWNQLGREVKLAADIVGENAKELTRNMQKGDIVLLENVRFDPREEENDDTFSEELASLAEIYVNDAFGTCHRAHSSTAGVAKYLPSAIGFLVEAELQQLGDNLNNPDRPFVAILGGKKVSDKIGVIDSLIDKCDTLLIGGGMAYTFFKAKELNIGTSVCEGDKLELAKTLLEKAEENNVNLVLPVDHVVTKEFSDDAECRVCKIEEIEDDEMGLDIGPETIELFEEKLQDAKTVFWNGPLGAFELKNYSKGTYEIAEFLATLSDCKTIIGGGDSASAVKKAGVADKMTHISTGGGASLEFVEGKELPGITAIPNK